VADEYADLALLKNWRGIKADDTRDDATLTVSLAGAVDWIHETTGRVFTLEDDPTPRTFRSTNRTYCTDDGLQAFVVDDIGSLDGLLVEGSSDGTSWSTVSMVHTAPDNALPRGRPITALLHRVVWPQWVRVTARWGWPVVPANVRQACLIQATRLSKRKDSPEGVMGGSEWGVVRLSRVDPDAKALLDPYCLPGFA
jgi:hypothetical protein